jgi:hypothetical protein
MLQFNLLDPVQPQNVPSTVEGTLNFRCNQCYCGAEIGLKLLVMINLD